MKNCVYDIFEEVNETKFPGFKKVNQLVLLSICEIFFLPPCVYERFMVCLQTTWLECIQEPGEIIFVPSGWHHQVYNLEDTISINHNWLNAYNLSWVVMTFRVTFLIFYIEKYATELK
jgi:hypothetical protein